MYRTLIFRSESDDEPEFNDSEDQIRPGSRDVAEAIVEELGRLSAVNVSSIDQHEFYGWGFYTEVEGGSFYNVLNPVEDEAYLTVSMSFFFIKRMLLKKPKKCFEVYCSILTKAVEATGGATDLKWEDYRT
ncbi:MAG: hypothetical protein ACSHYF_17390 [Verrucomicrobiaceae bacterium]